MPEEKKEKRKKTAFEAVNSDSLLLNTRALHTRSVLFVRADRSRSSDELPSEETT